MITNRKYKWIPFFGIHTYSAEETAEILRGAGHNPDGVEKMTALVFSWFDFEWIAMGKVIYKNAN